MKKWIGLILVAFETTIFAQADRLVVPIGFENQPGNASDGVLFTGGELQQMFRASSLQATWSTPVRITGVAFRVTEGAAASFNAVVPRIEFRMSTSSRPLEQMSTSYNLNKGLDEMIVYAHDNVVLSGAAGQTVNPFDLKFAFDQPFTYDPAGGNLLMYMNSTGSGAGGRNIDSHIFGDGISVGSSPVAYTGNSGPGGSNSVIPYALINEFTWVAIPEPSVMLLVLPALVMMLIGASKRR
jgi:hypothetical protein